MSSIDSETCKKFIIGSSHQNALTVYHFAKKILELHGEKGEEIVKDIVWEMGRTLGRLRAKQLEEEGLENNPDNYWREPSAITLAWKGGFVKRDPDEIIKEFSYCPASDGFKRLGPEAEKIGELYCELIDKTVWAGFNPDWEVTREKNFTKDGCCRLVWKKKTKE
jgi:hypothetical protein